MGVLSVRKGLFGPREYRLKKSLKPTFIRYGVKLRPSGRRCKPALLTLMRSSLLLDVGAYNGNRRTTTACSKIAG